MVVEVDTGMMRLLLLIHRLPCPPDGGAKLRASALLQYLARRHQVWCAGFLDGVGRSGSDPRAQASLAELRDICRDVVALPIDRRMAMLKATTSLLTGSTATEGYFASTVLRRRVLAWCSAVKFDAVLAFSSCMAPLALEVPARRRVLDLDDLDSVKWAESASRASWPICWAYRVESSRLGRRERHWLASFDASVLISQREAKLVDDATLSRRVRVIGPVLPGDVQQQLSGIATEAGQAGALPGEPVVSMLGAMDYWPNVDGACWFAESIWPRVLARRPDAVCWLVGRSPTRRVRRLDDRRSLRVTGTVSDIVPFLRRTRVSVAPLRLARGVQIKVLMAMAAGRPCVVTPHVAEGLSAKADRDLLVADSPASFSEAVIRLLDDAPLAEAIGRAGREWAATHWREDDSLARLEALLRSEPEAERTSVPSEGLRPIDNGPLWSRWSQPQEAPGHIGMASAGARS